MQNHDDFLEIAGRTAHTLQGHLALAKQAKGVLNGETNSVVGPNELYHQQYGHAIQDIRQLLHLPNIDEEKLLTQAEHVAFALHRVLSFAEGALKEIKKYRREINGGEINIGGESEGAEMVQHQNGAQVHLIFWSSQLQRAIDRIQQIIPVLSSAGYCVKCGQMIDPERIEAAPLTNLCVKCI